MRAFLIKIVVLLFALQVGLTFSQSRSQALKRQGELLMSEGRYGEAIDQLNKYIAANPRQSDGYHLRGLCYEERLEYQSAVLDLRRALRLPPQNPKIKIDLDRVIAVWHKLLYQKIDGHKRDIAIDPTYAFSYLEIGKSYRWLEEWKDAEIWYDEYLKRDDNASPDEIIRYTEILAKTGSVLKGERILKIFVDRYPDDWRLWSRYGYFTLWLGKNKIAENAFTKSLSYKPFFKEAEDGLDLAKRQGYLTQFQGKAFERVDTEYPIDRMYRLLKKNPDDDKMRFDLINDLIKTNRYEEANKQLQYLKNKHSEEENYKSLLNIVTVYRDSLFNKSVNDYTEKLKNNPNDKESVMKLAEAYGNQFYYDSSLEILDEYLREVPDNQDLDARMMYAKYAAWNYEWEKSIAQLDKLLALDPNNLDYQLLRGQIGVWTVNDLEIAEKYLVNVNQKNPKNLEALLSLVNLFTWKKDFKTAKIYLDQAKAEYPDNSEVENMESIYDLRFQANEEYKIFEIRGEAGRLTLDGKCEEALIKYDEYFEKRKSLTDEEKIEYADIANCAKDYNKAISLYDQVLANNFDLRIALLRAQNYFQINDTARATSELEKLANINPEDEQAQLLLADAYALTKRLSQAEAIYRLKKANAQDDVTKDEIDMKLLFLGGHYIDEKQFEKGKSIYDEVAATNQSPEIQTQLEERMLMYVESLAAAKEYDMANREFKILEKKITDPNKLNTLYKVETYMAYLLTQDKKYDEAEDLFDDLQTKIKDTVLVQDLRQKKMYLGDSYIQDESYGDARSIYDQLLASTSDTSQIRILNERIRWIPSSGFGRGLGYLSYLFPTNISISPFGNYYHDNQKLSLWNYGIRFDAGFIGFLSLGGLWSRFTLDNSMIRKEYTQIKGVASIYFSKLFSLSGSIGNFNTLGEPTYRIWDASVRFGLPENYGMTFSYENTDARLILYSPNMIYNHIRMDLYRINGF